MRIFYFLIRHHLLRLKAARPTGIFLRVSDIAVLYRYEKLLSEMLSHLERQPRNKQRRVVWLTHSEPLLTSLGLVLLAHFRRLLPLFFKWMHADDDETILLVRLSCNDFMYCENDCYFFVHFNTMTLGFAF